MMSRLALSLRDPELVGSSEEFKLTPIRFNGQTISGETGDTSMNTRLDERSV
jgi:hypothetical protein